jgi:hypothetical protein
MLGTALGLAVGVGLMAGAPGPAHAQPLGFLTAPPGVPGPIDASLLPGPPPAQPSRIDDAFRGAEQAIARGDDDTAIALLRGILARDPNLPRVQLTLGLVYFRTGAYEPARRALQAALAPGTLPLEIQGRVKLTLAEIERRLAPFQSYLFLQSGARYQTNANIGPDSTLVRAFGQNALRC